MAFFPNRLYRFIVSHTKETQVAESTLPTMNARDWVQLFLLGALWGASFFLAKVAVAEIAPLTLVFLRVSIAALALHVWLRIRGVSVRPMVEMAGGFAMLAILNNIIPFSLIFIGQTELGAGLASVINATTPFWTILVANVLTADEKLNWNKMSGILLGIAGTMVMIGPGMLAGLGGPAWAKLAILGATLSYAFAAIHARRFKAVDPALVATGQLTASTILMLPIALSIDGPAAVLAGDTAIWSAVIALALLSTAWAYILFFNIVASAGATNVSLVTLIVPASAILLGVAFLGELLEPFEMLGMGLIAIGLVTIDGRLFRLLRPRQAGS